VEPLGGVFAPVPGRAQRPAYAYGPKDATTKPVLFQCPVSAIPDVVWELLEHWQQSRVLGCLPVAGGLVDQPLLVRRAFPVFETEMRAIEDARRGPGASAAAMAGALASALGGGRRPRR